MHEITATNIGKASLRVQYTRFAVCNITKTIFYQVTFQFNI